MYDIDKVRQQFPMLNGKKMQNKPLVFLDNASTTFKPQCVIDAVDKYYLEYNSNAHRGDYDLAFNMDDDLSEIEFAAVTKCLYEAIEELEKIAKNE